MPRFFLHLHECGTVIQDEEGIDLPDIEAARAIATTSAREVMGAEIQSGRLCLACFIAIRDADGAEVARVMFRDTIAITGIESPVAGRRSPVAGRRSPVAGRRSPVANADPT